jgi:hypothetical protein
VVTSPTRREFEVRCIRRHHQAEVPVQLELNATTLPHLRNFEWKCKARSTHVGFNFSRLEALTHVHVEFSQAQACSIELINCPYLLELTLKTMRLEKFKLTEAEFFQYLECLDVGVVDVMGHSLPTRLPRIETLIYHVHDQFKSAAVRALVDALESLIPEDVRQSMQWYAGNLEESTAEAEREKKQATPI